MRDSKTALFIAAVKDPTFSQATFPLRPTDAFPARKAGTAHRD